MTGLGAGHFLLIFIFYDKVRLSESSNRINSMKKIPLTLTLLTFAAATVADENEQKRPWDVELDLGVIATSGNTETTSVQAKLDVKQNLEKWENQYVLSSLFKEDEVTADDGTKSKEKTAEKYFGSAKFAYLIGVEKSYLFGFGSHTSDDFGAYHSYNTIALGYGDWLYSGRNLNWFIEAGPGYFEGEKVTESDDPAIPDTITNESGAILRAATALEWKITETADFKQMISVESGSDNTRTQSETSLSTSITEAMKMKVGFTVANDTDVAPGKEKTDTTMFVNLAYHF
jgi:putative salt-induced outer membrane protein